MVAQEDVPKASMVVRKLVRGTSKTEEERQQDAKLSFRTKEAPSFMWSPTDDDEPVRKDPKYVSYLSHSNPCYEHTEEELKEHRQSFPNDRKRKCSSVRLDNIEGPDSLQEVITEKCPEAADKNENIDNAKKDVPSSKELMRQRSKEMVEKIINQESPPKKTCRIPHFGLILATLYGLSFSFINLLAKMMVNYHPICLVTYRFLIMMLPTLPFVLFAKQHPFPKGNRVGLMARAICGCFNLILRFVALSHIALADATVISYTSPVFIAIFAKLFLKEKCGIFTSLVILVSLSGVILVARPPFLFGMDGDYHNDMWGVAASFGGVLFSSGGVVAIRSLKGVHSSVVLLSSTLVSLIISGILAFSLNVFSLPMSVYDGLLLLALGIMSFVAEVVLTVALQYEEAGPVSICRTSEVVFAFTWQAVFFNLSPHYLSIVGALLVVSAAIFIGMKKIIANLSEESKIRQILWFVLR